MFLCWTEVVFLRHLLTISDPLAYHMLWERFGKLGLSGRPHVLKRFFPENYSRPLGDPCELGPEVGLSLVSTELRKHVLLPLFCIFPDFFQVGADLCKNRDDSFAFAVMMLKLGGCDNHFVLIPHNVAPFEL